MKQAATCQLAEMVEAAHQALEKFVKTKEAAAVLIDSSGNKAFCAGQLLGFFSCGLHISSHIYMLLLHGLLPICKLINLQVNG